MNNYPASEQRIREVERGRVCNAILPMPGSSRLSAGDSILFSLAYAQAGEEPCFVRCGDSVCVSLTEVTDLRATDPATGRALYQVSWSPLGRIDAPGNAAKSVAKSRGSRGRS